MADGSTGTVGKALDVLTLLGDFPHGATVSQLAERLDYPFSTVYRLLNTVVGTGFVDYDPDLKRYQLGLRLFQLGQRIASARGLDGIARPILESLTRETGESSLLAVLDGSRHLTVHKVDGPQFRSTTDPGDHGRLHTTALGKVLVAFSAIERREELIETVELTAETPRSITDRDAFRAEIALTAERGWASQTEENDIGMTAIAVPVVSAQGHLLAGLALAAPLFRHDVTTISPFLPHLKTAAAQLSVRLFTA